MLGKLTFKKDSLDGIIGSSSEALCGILAQFCVGCGVAEMFKAGAIKLRRFHDHYLAAFVAMRYCCVLPLSLSLSEAFEAAVFLSCRIMFDLLDVEFFN